MIAADIIILGFIAGFILYRLYITIGRRDDDGESHSFTKKEDFSKIIDISSIVRTVEDEVSPLSSIENDLSKGFEEVVSEIRKIDSSFSLEKFLDGAKKAFEMVLVAFAENDRQTLESLLDDNVYKQFISEVDKRVKNNVVLNLSLVALPRVEIRNIQLKSNTVLIDVFYYSQQITILKDSAGAVIEGDVSHIDNIEDIWTFSKELNSGNNWLLVKVNAA